MATFGTDALDLIQGQDGIVSRQQLLACGVSKEAIRWNSGRSWRVVLPRVYLLGRESITQRQRHIAALLYAGPGSVITGAVAAEFHGVGSATVGEVIDVITLPSRRRRSAGFVTVRPSLVVDAQPSIRGPLAYASVGRACVDAAASLRSPSMREAVFIEAIQKGLVSLDDLSEWVYRIRPREAAALHAALDSAASGAWSLPESRLLELMSTSRVLPPAWPNAKIEDARGLPLLTPDAWIDDVAMAVLVHSRRYHSRAHQWDATVERDAGLVAAGVVVAGVTPHQIDADPYAVLARLEATYRAAAARVRPKVTAYEKEGWLRLPESDSTESAA